LHEAVEGGHAAIIEVLLDAGADLEARTMTEYYTPLDLARNQKRTDIVDLLIQRGAVK
jgi:ankyrin repeat protein